MRFAKRSLLLAVFALAASAPGAAAAVGLQPVGNFESPVYVTGAPGDYSRLYVVERAGTVRVVRGGAVLPAPFLDLHSEVSSGGERGMLSIAFAPDYQRSRLVYVYYTGLDGSLRLEELRAPTPDQADPASRRLVLQIPHASFSNHNGGQIVFGPDGYLYLGPGDGGGGYDPPGNAQNTGALLGKLLRIDPRARTPYGIPPGNPFAGGGGASEVWSYGLRNPYRFSFDRLTGDLVVADVGQDVSEEVDYLSRASGAGRGANLGWDRCEGSYRSDPPPTDTSIPCPLTGDVRPVLEHLHDESWVAIIGGYVVRDPSLPSLVGRYVYGDNSVRALRSALLRTPRAVDDRPVGVDVTSLSSFGEDTAGCVYAASLEGPVDRLVDTSREVPCPASAAAPSGALTLRVRVPNRQRLRSRHSVRAYARCNRACTVSMSGRLRIGRRLFRLRSSRVNARANRRVTLRARLTPAGRRALGRRRRGRARLTLSARDSTGARSPVARRSVRVRP